MTGQQPTERHRIARQRIDRVRRDYNKWAANQTLEDFALRFTAKGARRWSVAQVGHTAFGAVSFLALEAIGGSITLSYGFANASAAMVAPALVIFATALPICVHAARAGVDIDLLTRGAGFGYLGSTITSLIYASFTFLFFAIESVILAMALELCLGIPQGVGYLVSAVVVIPLVTYGISAISRFQLWTQPLFLALNVLPVAAIALHNPPDLAAWRGFPGAEGEGFTLVSFGAAASVTIALIVQVGEQVDFLRFLPDPSPDHRRHSAGWWTALLACGPGWIVTGLLKLFAGSFLAVVLVRHGVPRDLAAQPPRMYARAFAALVGPGPLSLALTCLLVVTCQLKINVTNAYAGSIAWSNFFSRLTHLHPGRVVWLVFNVLVALLVMEIGIYRALEQTLAFYSSVAVAWVGALVADLVVNKPLGLSPPGIEFKRAHLYDVNPVGVGAMAAAIIVATVARLGALGPLPQAFAPFLALVVALVTAPLIAWATGGRYYLARPPSRVAGTPEARPCSLCENAFEPEDMAMCPAYHGPICSLCCSLDVRCHDLCKPHGRLHVQLATGVERVLPAFLRRLVRPDVGEFLLTFVLLAGVVALVLALIGVQLATEHRFAQALLSSALRNIFGALLIVVGVASWWFHLNRLSRRAAQEETLRQTDLLLAEIDAHERTDAALKKAKEAAEAANVAKSRYVVGLSHELRTPLNAIMGYAQLLERDDALPARSRQQVTVMRRNTNHLAALIDGLLDIAKIEAGKLDLARDEVAIHALVAQVAEPFAAQALDKNIGFRVGVAPDLPPVVAVDGKRLRQILINLLSNAVKFTHQGSVDLAVTYRNQVADFAVSDTGPGIAAADHERIFVPFERLTAGRAEAGTGLGLTICRLLSNVMGGDLGVTSAPGQGSTFRLRLFMPRLDVAPPPLASDAIGAAPVGRDVRILLVDDDPVHCDIVATALTRAGFDTHDAGDAEAALALARDIAFDLFILDIELPDLDGWRLAERLRGAGHQAPVVMLSASAVGEHRSDIALPFHDAFLMKPVDLDQLRAVASRLLALDPEPEGRAARVRGDVTGLERAAIPGAGDLDRLVHLCEIGFTRGLRDALHAIAEADARHRPFTDILLAHLDEIDLGGMMRALDAVQGAVT